MTLSDYLLLTGFMLALVVTIVTIICGLAVYLESIDIPKDTQED